MSEVKLPSSQELRNALLVVLGTSTEAMSTGAIDAAVASMLNLTSEQKAIIRSGNRTEFAYRLAWERTHAKNKGLIERVGTRNWRIVSNSTS